MQGWGFNSTGQVGDGTGNNSIKVPTTVVGLSGSITAIAAGGRHSLALVNGAVYAWGDNSNGELGNGTTDTSAFHGTPLAVSALSSGVTAIATGDDRDFAIRNGELWGWGAAVFGDGTTDVHTTPYAVPTLSSGVTAVDGGHFHSLALENGGVVSWGANNVGQLGSASIAMGSNSLLPVTVTGLSNGVTAISAGYEHNLALQNGVVYAWGYNAFGQLGDGSKTNRGTPVALSLPSNVSAVAAGGFHSVALVNGSVYAWGSDSWGQVGDASINSNRLTPVQIDPVDLTNIIAIAASANSSFALSADGSLWVWGGDDLGQLALGPLADSAYPTPQHLLPPSGMVYTSIDGGSDHVIATLAPAPIPEPTTLSLLLMAGVASCVRRRQS
jgi:alpha-tubulin suppressor-like RCC1 family protein